MPPELYETEQEALAACRIGLAKALTILKVERPDGALVEYKGNHFELAVT